jgi:hypothetical protein
MLSLEEWFEYKVHVILLVHTKLFNLQLQKFREHNTHKKFASQENNNVLPSIEIKYQGF